MLTIGPLRGGRNRCEVIVTPHGGSGGGLCGFRAAWWDGRRFLCKDHKPGGELAEEAGS